MWHLAVSVWWSWLWLVRDLHTIHSSIVVLFHALAMRFFSISCFLFSRLVGRSVQCVVLTVLFFSDTHKQSLFLQTNGQYFSRFQEIVVVWWKWKRFFEQTQIQCFCQQLHNLNNERDTTHRPRAENIYFDLNNVWQLFGAKLYTVNTSTPSSRWNWNVLKFAWCVHTIDATNAVWESFLDWFGF